MLDVINRYAHGFVAVPVILACKQQGFFKLLASQAPLTSQEIARHINGNEGQLVVG